jgi:hypothetical protein
MRTRLVLGASLTAALAAFAVSSAPAGAQPPGFPKGGILPKAGELRKYDDVITKEFKTQPGVFAVHRNEDKVFFEVPESAYGRLFLWHAEVAKGPGGNSWGGAALGHVVIKFERRGNKIFIWKVGFSKRRSMPARPIPSSRRSRWSAKARTGRRW